MVPLKEFICDKCGGVIKSTEEGYVIWNNDDDLRVGEIHIVHQSIRDENNILHGCDDPGRYSCSLPLKNFLGVNGLVLLLSFIDPGPHFYEKYKDEIINKRNFIEFFRRVQIPYYEEARIYWNRAEEDGFFAGVNEFSTYSPDTLKRLIGKYKDR